MDEVELARACVLYYQHGMTHAEVGETMGWSRVKTTRYLQQARELGIVTFDIKNPVAPFEHVADQIRTKFHVDQCTVAPAFPDTARTLNSVGVAAAPLLQDFLPDRGTIGVSASRAVAAAIRKMTKTNRPQSVVAAMSGTSPRIAIETSSSIAIELAHRIGAEGYTVPAPLHSSLGTTSALLEDNSVAGALKRAAESTHLLIGVGSMDLDGGITLNELRSDTQKDLIAAGAIGDLGTRFYDSELRPVDSPLEKTTLALKLEQILAIPRKMIIAAGETKAKALRTVLEHTTINYLAIDLSLAQALLKLPQQNL